ncbi:hypothetical protein OEA41_002461 [Lepraria neglecta]|uniref:Uncharacterized protein n=1 Tax=Lepraria neglecta TaxID=209136 RepID=A0AAE0DMP6_9LECA|nr:hypothetical protein OEA41_002461 [Lepraria neglecta]
MAAQATSLAKLKDYVSKLKEIDYDPESTNGGEDYEARITSSLQSLQNQVKQHQAALEKVAFESSGAPHTKIADFLVQLRAIAPTVSVEEPAQDPKVRLRQLRVVTGAYRSLTPAEPLLPLPNSPLPALLALRSTLNLVDDTKTSIIETKEDISKARLRLQQEQDDLGDARSITQALEQRIKKLRLENEEQSHKSREDVAKAMIQEQQQKRRHYMAELRKLVVAFNKFADEHLAAMIAAEDLGGPVVGDLLDIDEETLKAGFNQQGKAKKIKEGNNGSDPKRKRRNEEVWGSKDEDMEEGTRSEKEAAEADFRSLTEDLLNAAAGDEDSDPYIRVRRESAAVRFLVRAKVAQFHPDDARKLLLRDFGKELDE